MLVLFGATGYVGSRTAEAMVARGLRPVLAGRDPARLAVLAARLGGLATAQADVADRTSVFELVSSGDVLVSTVGPFRALGWPAVRAAVRAGAVYVDSAAEARFVRGVHDWFGPQAVEAGAALLTGFGHASVPGVLAGAVALRNAGSSARRVDIGYFLTGGGAGLVSRATARAVMGVLLDGGYAWRDGEMRAEATAARSRAFVVDGRPQPAVTIGASEQYALPRLAPGLRTVDVYAGWFGSASGWLHAAAPMLPKVWRVPGAQQVATAIGNRVADRLLPAAPAAAAAQLRTHVVAEVFDEAGVLLARTRCEASDPWSTTAGLLAWGAAQAVERGVVGTGACDAISAFGLDAVLAGAAEIGIRLTGADRPE